MINAKFLQLNGRYVGFSVSGHANYDDYGNDIVCASVTSAVQLIANGITETLSVPARVEVRGDNEINLMLPENCDNENAYAFLSSLHLHLDVLSQDYKGTIQISNLEV